MKTAEQWLREYADGDPFHPFDFTGAELEDLIIAVQRDAIHSAAHAATAAYRTSLGGCIAAVRALLPKEAQDASS